MQISRKDGEKKYLYSHTVITLAMFILITLIRYFVFGNGLKFNPILYSFSSDILNKIILFYFMYLFAIFKLQFINAIFKLGGICRIYFLECKIIFAFIFY